MNCKKCNSPLKTEDVFCQNCGERVDTVIDTIEPIATPVAEPTPAASVQPVSPVASGLQSTPVAPVTPVQEPTPAASVQPVSPVASGLQSTPVAPATPVAEPTPTAPAQSVVNEQPVNDMPRGQIQEPVVSISESNISNVSQPTENKKSKGLLIVLILAIIVILGIMGFVVYKYLIPKTEPTTKNTKETETIKETVKKDYTVIGNDKFGYLKLPGEWVKFKDVEGKTAIQYTKDNYIVSIESYPPATVDQTAETLAKASLYNMQTNEVNVSNVQGATIKLGNYDAYQTYCFYNSDNTWLVEWFLEPGDDRIHYISVEGPDASSEYFKIPETFSLTKIK